MASERSRAAVRTPMRTRALNSGLAIFAFASAEISGASMKKGDPRSSRTACSASRAHGCRVRSKQHLEDAILAFSQISERGDDGGQGIHIEATNQAERHHEFMGQTDIGHHRAPWPTCCPRIGQTHWGTRHQHVGEVRLNGLRDAGLIALPQAKTVRTSPSPPTSSNATGPALLGRARRRCSADSRATSRSERDGNLELADLAMAVPRLRQRLIRYFEVAFARVCGVAD